MTEGNIQQKMVRFAIPIFLGDLFQQFYNVVDALIVGNVLGKDALAAVTSDKVPPLDTSLLPLTSFISSIFKEQGTAL